MSGIIVNKKRFSSLFIVKVNSLGEKMKLGNFFNSTLFYFFS